VRVLRASPLHRCGEKTKPVPVYFPFFNGGRPGRGTGFTEAKDAASCTAAGGKAG